VLHFIVVVKFNANLLKKGLYKFQFMIYLVHIFQQTNQHKDADNSKRS
jgi:CRISPR/Cas system-associated protein endoribonuclease Cas2